MMDEGEDDFGLGKRQNNQQACETCRSRKVKCDGHEPCAVCQKLNVECHYRETKPTKKDKTLVHILETIRSLESKVDQALLGNQPSFLPSTSRSSPSKYSEYGDQTSRYSSSSGPAGSRATPYGASPQAPMKPRAPARRIEGRKVASWPAVQTILQAEFASLPNWEQEGDNSEKWLSTISREFASLPPADEPVNFNFLGGVGSRVWEEGTVYLTKSIIEELCTSFFNSLHAIYPILDPRHFYTMTLPQAYRACFDVHDESSCLVMIVLALGAVAKEGIAGPNLVEPSGRRTGVRGGSTERPPGLAFSNEAKKRLGYIMTRHDLLTLQSFLLLSIYYSQVSRNLDYWHLTSFSAIICLSVVRAVDNWKTTEGDLIARSYWMCVLMQGGLICELGLFNSSLPELESTVPLPLFLSISPDDINQSGDDLFIHLHFLAQITLRAQLDRINSSLQTYKNPFQSDDSDDALPTTLIAELLRQLHAWRAALPAQLVWTDNDPVGTSAPVYPSVVPPYAPATAIPVEQLSTLSNAKTTLRASLRTRYKYAEYLIWRPYLYKVMHFPTQTTETDLQGCREAFKACSNWPLTHPAFQDQRRLIPHLYEYSHTFFGILVLVHVCSLHHRLAAIMAEPSIAAGWAPSRVALLCWIRDMQIVHPVARWGWQLLRILYKGEEGVRNG